MFAPLFLEFIFVSCPDSQHPLDPNKPGTPVKIGCSQAPRRRAANTRDQFEKSWHPRAGSLFACVLARQGYPSKSDGYEGTGALPILSLARSGPLDSPLDSPPDTSRDMIHSSVKVRARHLRGRHSSPA
jgi:hypothetical protein